MIQATGDIGTQRSTVNTVQYGCETWTHTHTHNHFMALWILSGTTRVSRYQKHRCRDFDAWSL